MGVCCRPLWAELFFPRPSHLSLHLRGDSPAVMGSLSKWLRKYKSQQKGKHFSVCICLRIQLHEHQVSFHGADEDQVLWSVLRSSITLRGTGCGPKLSDYSNRCEARQCTSPVAWLESVTVLHLKDEIEKYLFQRLLWLFEGRKKISSLKKTHGFLLQRFWNDLFLPSSLFFFPGSHRGVNTITAN